MVITTIEKLPLSDKYTVNLGGVKLIRKKGNTIFVAYLIPSEDELREKVEAILTEIETEKINFYSLTHRQKAFIHTWLAWQEKPGMPMGQAITAKVLSDHSAIASIFLNWLNNLFNTK
ncbi:MAG: DUF3226 domain-containing protein [Spirulinaceae cyanobacterium]